MNLPYFGFPMTATVPADSQGPRRDPFEVKCDTIRELQGLIKLIEQDRVTSASIAYRSEGEAVSLEYGIQGDGA